MNLFVENNQRYKTDRQTDTQATARWHRANRFTNGRQKTAARHRLLVGTELAAW